MRAGRRLVSPRGLRLGLRRHSGLHGDTDSGSAPGATSGATESGAVGPAATGRGHRGRHAPIPAARDGRPAHAPGWCPAAPATPRRRTLGAARRAERRARADAPGVDLRRGAGLGRLLRGGLGGRAVMGVGAGVGATLDRHRRSAEQQHVGSRLSETGPRSTTIDARPVGDLAPDAPSTDSVRAVRSC